MCRIITKTDMVRLIASAIQTQIAASQTSWDRYPPPDAWHAPCLSPFKKALCRSMNLHVETAVTSFRRFSRFLNLRTARKTGLPVPSAKAGTSKNSSPFMCTLPKSPSVPERNKRTFVASVTATRGGTTRRCHIHRRGAATRRWQPSRRNPQMQRGNACPHKRRLACSPQRRFLYWRV